MPTLLVNRRMNPALAARVVDSVSGNRRIRGNQRRLPARLRLLLRLGVVLGAVGFLGSMVHVRHTERTRLDEVKADLRHEWAQRAAALSPDDHGSLAHIEQLLARYAGDYPGDGTAKQLLESGALRATLERPLLYVRGPVESFGDSEHVKRAATESRKDSLLLCLLDPPSDSAEKSMLAPARLALAGGTPVNKITPQVRNLRELELGLPYLLPAWSERIDRAQDHAELNRLQKDLRRAPLDGVRGALRAEVLLVVMDEPNEGGGATELDGEHAHKIRVTIADARSGEVLLRMRRLVDPSWITPNRRSQYARELDGCRLALELHAAVKNAELGVRKEHPASVP